MIENNKGNYLERNQNPEGTQAFFSVSNRKMLMFIWLYSV